MNMKKCKILIIATTPKMIRYFLLNHIYYFTKNYDVVILSNFDEQEDILDTLSSSVRQYSIPIVRDINILMDIKTLFFLIFYFYKEKPLAVYSISPKGGGLGMFAALLTKVPIRIHTFTGQVWVNKKGLLKLLLLNIDKAISLIATNVFVDSQSQCDFIVKKNIVSKEKTIVLGNGSISGVDLERFYPTISVSHQVKKKMNTDQFSIIFLFVGRLKIDKGVFELINSFAEVSKKTPDTALWFVGDDEDDLKHDLEKIASAKKCLVKFIPYTTVPENYMKAADVLCLPSYREGFGNSIIEAAACGIPSIGSRIYGITDAIVDGETGFLIEQQSVSDLTKAMFELATNFHLRKTMGKAARKRAVDKFDANEMSAKLLKILNELVRQNIKNIV